jgi:hypothetical protein
VLHQIGVRGREKSKKRSHENNKVKTNDVPDHAQEWLWSLKRHGGRATPWKG